MPNCFLTPSGKIHFHGRKNIMMKKIISISLLLCLHLSLAVIPAAATDPAEGRTNVALGAALAGGSRSGGYWFSSVNRSNTVTDGVKSHNHSAVTTFVNLKVDATG